MTFPDNKSWYKPELVQGDKVELLSMYAVQQRTDWSFFDKEEIQDEFRKLQFMMDNDSYVLCLGFGNVIILTKKTVSDPLPPYLFKKVGNKTKPEELKYAIHRDFVDAKYATYKTRTREQAEVVLAHTNKRGPTSYVISSLEKKKGLYLL